MQVNDLMHNVKKQKNNNKTEVNPKFTACI